MNEVLLRGKQKTQNLKNMPEQKQHKILLIDDDTFIRGVYAEVLKGEGFIVVEANNGLEGLNLVEKENPDLIFTGIIMPRMTGFELMEALKKNIKTANIPVVVSSHLGRFEDQKKAYELGAKDFIYRGEVTPAEAVKRIKSVLGEKIIYQVSLEEGGDALELAKFLGKENLNCPKCNSKYTLTVEYNARERKFLLSLICAFCAEEGKE